MNAANFNIIISKLSSSIFFRFAFQFFIYGRCHLLRLSV